MNPTVRNILAVLAGAIIGGVVNMALIMSGPLFIEFPEGFNPEDQQSLIEYMPKFEFKHFIMPFLAHAIGTLVGAIIAVKIGASRKLTLALIIGALFFIGGAMNVAMLNAPMWFNITDLVLAYFPMAYLGWKLADK
ncbi:MAG: hypothetical protein KDC12_02930 [Flavobacteriales bacterium]|nr:hypothetical protein [Flavobacteriales bacterium]